jgi:pyridoxine 5-phosphate synthase
MGADGEGWALTLKCGREETMPLLSVNVNKVATLRNSRGAEIPRVTDAVNACIAAGARGITVHPRADERHIRASDVRDIAALLAARHARGEDAVEFNIEGDPRAELMDLVCEVRPTQCTLVPVTPGEITSHAGWSPDTPEGPLREVIDRLHQHGIRVSLFVDPVAAAVRWAAAMGPERIEIYTEPFARAFASGAAAGKASFASCAEASALAHDLGLGVNAGHDLDLDNLVLFRTLPHLAEVSIGHALIAHALYVGLGRAVRDYLAACRVQSPNRH